MGTLANSENQDEMQHNAAFHQGLHCLLRLIQSSGAEVHDQLENTICDPFKYIMDDLNSYKPLVPLCYIGKQCRTRLDATECSL